MSIPFINNPTIPPTPPPSVQSNMWDSAGRNKHMLLGEIKSVYFNFGKGAVAGAAVYIECVEDDIGQPRKYRTAAKFSKFGQYFAGDKILCPQLSVTINGGTVKVINPVGDNILLPTGSGGSLVKPPYKWFKYLNPGFFHIDSTNAHKYNIICFANHSPLPTIPS